MKQGELLAGLYSSPTILKMEATSSSENQIPVHDLHCIISMNI
jgi:hypothetical protein